MKKDALVRLPSHVHAKLKLLAEEEKRTMVAMIEVMINDFLDSRNAIQK